MRVNSIIALSAAVAGVAAAPFQFPLADGFPVLSNASLDNVTVQAQGSIPTAKLPKYVKPAGVVALQLFGYNEVMEVAFFAQLLANVTDNVPGYEASSLVPLTRDYVIEMLNAIVNQEQIHALSITWIFESIGQTPISPCEYDFPVSNWASAIQLAKTFTDVDIATNPTSQGVFAEDGGEEINLIIPWSATLANEAEQNGLFRFLQGEIPSSTSFLTGGSPLSFAFTAMQKYFVPDSCPQPLSDVNLTTYPPLDIVNTPEAKNMTLEFMIPGDASPDNNSIVYLYGLNVPVTVPISDITSIDGMSHFTAEFPFDTGFGGGLTVAALVTGHAQYAAKQDVADDAVYGPALIELI